MTTKDLLRALPKPQEDNYLMTKKHRDMKAKKKEEDFYKKYPECRIKISFSNNVSGNNQRLILDHFFGTAGLYERPVFGRPWAKSEIIFNSWNVVSSRRNYIGRHGRASEYNGKSGNNSLTIVYDYFHYLDDHDHLWNKFPTIIRNNYQRIYFYSRFQHGKFFNRMLLS